VAQQRALLAHYGWLIGQAVGSIPDRRIQFPIRRKIMFSHQHLNGVLRRLIAEHILIWSAEQGKR
jgi:hypothetical protein